jgi:hypothetical protein
MVHVEPRQLRECRDPSTFIRPARDHYSGWLRHGGCRGCTMRGISMPLWQGCSDAGVLRYARAVVSVTPGMYGPVATGCRASYFVMKS